MIFFKNLFIQMRPHQYIKNAFILLPLFFAAKITEQQLFMKVFMAFVAFSLVASFIYTLNDYRDIEEDRLHPVKKYRPLASGVITKSQAIFIMLLLFASGLTIMMTISLQASCILLLYVGFNVAYSLFLKHIAIVDITIIAIGFVLRLFIGSIVTNIQLSMWIVVITYLLALFLALAKRRDDVLIYLDSGKKMRNVVDGYNLQFLNAAMTVMASVVIVAYTIYTTSPEVTTRVHSNYLYLTSFYVILGIMRYLQITLVFEDSGSPTKIVLTDRFMQITLAGWLLNFTWILY